MKIGMIGFGTMGSMLADALVMERQYEIFRIYNRSIKKSPIFEEAHIEYHSNYRSIIGDSDIIFLCLSPAACVEFLEKDGASIPEGTILVSIAGDLELRNIARFFKGSVVRIMPTLLSKVHHGSTLICGDEKQVEKVMALFNSSMVFKCIPESKMDAFTTITSCGPGLLASMLHEYVSTLSDTYNMEHAEVEGLVKQAIQGVCALADGEYGSFKSIVDDVASSPTGITASGSKVLRNRIPSIFSEMLSAMEKRHTDRKSELESI